MRKIIKITTATSAIIFLFGLTLIVHGQGFQLGQPGPQPYKYQPYAENLTKKGPISSNPNAEQSQNSIIKDAIGYGLNGLNWITLKAIGYILFVVNYIIGMIGSLIFTLASLLLEFGLYLNTTILDSEVVQLGWRITRDLANLGFTIGIIIIAYATMLGIESYGTKKMLFHFIVAAVMVNFSFSIAGFFIDASNMATNFFISKSIGGDPATALPFSGIINGTGNDSGAKKFAESLANAFAPQKLLSVNSNDLGKFKAVAEEGSGIIILVISMFFIAFFTILAALGMLAIALTTLDRFVRLSGYIILMPIAILAGGFDNFKSQWSKWKSGFIAQLIYLPLAVFTIYLVLMFVDIKAQVGLSAQNPTNIWDVSSKLMESGNVFNASLALMAKPFQVITDMILVLIMLFMGIMASIKIGHTTGSSATKAIDDVRDWAIGKIKGAPGTATRWTLNQGPEPDKSLGNRMGNAMARIPLVRGLVPKLRGFLAGATSNIDTYAATYKNMTTPQLLANARKKIHINPEEDAGILKALIDKKAFSDDPAKGLSMQELDRYMPIAKRYGIKDILTVAPDQYQEFGMNDEKLGKFMREKMNTAEAIDIMHEGAFRNKAVVANLNNAHLKRLSENWNAEKRTETLKTIRHMNFDDLTPFMENALGRGKNLEDVHPDFIKENAIFTRLNEGHINYLGKEGEPIQRKEFLKKFHDAYTNGLLTPEDDMKKYDVFAKNMMVDNIPSWSGFGTISETKKAYQEIKNIYEKRRGMQPPLPPQPPPSSGGPQPRGGRGAGGGAGPKQGGGGGTPMPPPPPTHGLTSPTPPQPPPPPQKPPSSPGPTPQPPPVKPTTPPSPEQIKRINAVLWNIQARKKDLEQLAQEKETRPTIIKSAEDSLKRAEKEYERITKPTPEKPLPPQ